MELISIQKYLLLVLVAILIGPLLSEFVGVLWHYLVAHIGVLRWLPNDFLRRRHFDHHESPDKYPPNKLRGMMYRESCEIVFHFLAFILLPFMGLLVWLDFMQLQYAVSLIIGATLYGIIVQGTLHTWYHLEDNTLKKFYILKNKWCWRFFQWLRDCHDIHHYLRANYFILIPLPDILFGTLVTRKRFEKMNEPAKQDLFPSFRSTPSFCGKPFFRD